MARNDKIVELLKSLQEMNKSLRYQVCLGKDDIEVRLKNNFCNDYRPYTKIDLNVIDPNGDIPDWELTGIFQNLSRPLS